MAKNLMDRSNDMYERLHESIKAKVTLTPEEKETIKHYFIPKKLRKRQYLLNAGDVCQYLAFVEKGLLRLFSTDDKSHEHVIQFAMEGWWASDMSSFLSGDDAQYNIEALEDSELLLLTNTTLEELMEKVPRMERYFRLLMQNNIVALRRRVTSTQSDSAEEKYKKLMKAYPDLINRSPQHDLASYLGITPETLSRIRKQISTKK
ncbi:MAG TPA: Crp/Fnr family transcriptional regulator [Cyclobacteriaceae bacterium]|jgi:CRP-like cAMP-binding protein|nr:Crp/Fnr family transcriptional regulator [Cyclobacteriaceae bacterium]